MARFTIYSKDSQSKRYSGEPQYHGSYMGVDYVEFRSVSSPILIPWEIGDYVDYSRTGMRYKLYSLPMPKKVGRAGAYGASFEYSNVQFYAATKELEIAPFRDLVTDDNRIHFSTRPEVATYEDVHGIARRIQACMDDLYPNRWRIEVVETDDADLAALLTETKEFSVSNGSCLDALSQIYELWKNVGWIHTYDPVSDMDIITIGKANVRTSDNTTDALACGLGKGLTSIKKAAANSEEFATRLYVYGSDRNIQTRYYNGFDILNKDSVDIRNLMIPLEKWGKTDGLPDARKAYLQADDEIIEKYGLIPRTIYFDGSEHEEIYPSIVGLTCNKVREAMIEAGEGDSVYLPPTTDDRIDKVRSAYGWGDGSKEDIEGIPTFTMYIRQVGFDIASQGKLTTEGHATISMKSGMCAGREFKVKAFRLYKDNNQPELELEKFWDDSLGMSFPNTLYPISEEDEFVLLDIPMPDYYIKLAEDRLYEAAERLLADYTRVSAFYEPGIDPIRVSVAGKILRAGMYMQVYDEDIVDTEDKKDYVLIDTITIDEKSNPALYSVTLREQKRSVRTFGSLESMIDDAKESAKVGLKRERMYTDRRFRSSEETLAMLKSAFTNFSEGINPVTVNTIALLVGDESLQFKFTKALSSLTDAECPLTYDNTTKQLSASSISYIKHMTLGVSAVSSSRVASDFKGWRIPTYSEVLEDTEARYVYIKASKSSTTGAFVMSKTAIGMEDVSGYYHFLVGVLNSEYNGMRDFVTLYGFTEVLPGQITTDILRSANGNLVIDLANAVISAKNGARINGSVTIGSDSSGLENLSEWADKQTEIDNAQSTADTAVSSAQEAKGIANTANASVAALGTRVDVIDQTILEINDKLDGVVENYYDDYIPSRYNPPASQWIADETEQEHIGDTFTNTALEGDGAGKSWRWLEKNGIYDWHLITDSDATKALALAAEAKAAADGKTKTFLVTPSNYAEGDLWIVGDDVPSEFLYEKGTILYATKAGTTYAANNWAVYVDYAKQTELDAITSDLNDAIAEAEQAAKNYTDAGKAALQESIDALNDAKANIEDVYDKGTADTIINSAEQSAIEAAQGYANAAQSAAEKAAKAYADGVADEAEKAAIADAESKLATAKQELEEAIAEVEEIANTADAATKTLDTRISDVETGLTESVAEINARLDGVVENYFEDGAPTTKNKPVTDWIAASEDDDYELINHVGDTYTNIEEYVDDTTTPYAGKSWRWCWCDDSSITDKIEVTDKEGETRYLHWHPIADSDAVKALLEAAKAKTTADGKSKNFITQPVPPYKEGDLWVEGETGDIYRCKDGVNRTSGSFVSSEWELASKYTDDTKANAAQGDATKALADAAAAQSKADSAQAVADAAKNELDSWLADDVITPVEKQALRNELESIKADYNDIMSDCDRYGIAFNVDDATSIRYAYHNAYDTYAESLLSVINTSGVVDGEDVRESQGAYYTARTNILNAISEAAKKIADDANNTLNSWLADGIITPVEKQAVRNEMAQVYNEYDAIYNDAGRYGLLNEQSWIVYEAEYNQYYQSLEGVLSDLESGETVNVSQISEAQGNYYEARTAILDLIESTSKAAVDGMEYLTNIFGNGNNLNVTGGVLAQMLAVSNSANEIEAFINGSDTVGYDTEHGKLLLAAGIDNINEPEKAKTRIYEDGHIESNDLTLREGCKIGEDMHLGDNDGVGYIEMGEHLVSDDWLKISEGSLHAHSKSYHGVLQAISMAGCTGHAMVISVGGSGFYCIDREFDIGLEVDAPNAWAHCVPRGIFAGLRPKTKVIATPKTASDPNVLDEFDFSVLVNATSGTYYIKLPTSPLDGQEYVIESKVAMNIAASQNIYQFYSGTTVSQVTTSGKQVLRFKYYASANQWTCIILA